MIAPSKGSVPGRAMNCNEECLSNLRRSLPSPSGLSSVTQKLRGWRQNGGLRLVLEIRLPLLLSLPAGSPSPGNVRERSNAGGSVPREAEATVAGMAPQGSLLGAVLSRLSTRRTRLAGSTPNSKSGFQVLSPHKGGDSRKPKGGQQKMLLCCNVNSSLQQDILWFRSSWFGFSIKFHFQVSAENKIILNSYKQSFWAVKITWKHSYWEYFLKKECVVKMIHPCSQSANLYLIRSEIS